MALIVINEICNAKATSQFVETNRNFSTIILFEFICNIL